MAKAETRWHPDENVMGTIQRMITLSMSHRPEDQAEAMQLGNTVKDVREVNLYLAKIFSDKTRSTTDSSRAVAGLLLKNNIVRGIGAEGEETAITKAALLGLKEPTPNTRSAATSILAALVCGGAGEVFAELKQGLDSQNEYEIEGCLIALKKITEDCEMLDTQQLDRQLPSCLSLLAHPAKNIRQAALETVNEMLPHRPDAASQGIPSILSALSSELWQDRDERTRLSVCRTFFELTENFDECIEPVFPSILDHMLRSFSYRETPVVAMEACEFWLSLAQKPFAVEVFTPLLDRIVPAALQATVYEKNDTEVADFLREEQGVETGERPRQDVAENSKEEASEWSLRKGAALLLDTLSVTLEKEKYFPVIFPLLSTMLGSAEWSVLEAGLLVLGAVVECVDSQSTETVVSCLLCNTQHPHGLVRRISFWALGRFGQDIARLRRTKTSWGSQTIESFLRGMGDQNIKVRVSAVDGLACLSQSDSLLIEESLQSVLSGLIKALREDARARKDVLYNISVIAGTVADDNAKREFTEQLLDPLLGVYGDEEAAQVLDCIGAISNRHISSHIEKVERIVHAVLAEYTEDMEDLEGDQDTVSACVGLMGRLIEADRGAFRFYAANADLVRRVLSKAARDGADARQAVFALIGDMHRADSQFFSEFCFPLARVLVANFVPADEDSVAASNNAVWAYGLMHSSGCYGDSLPAAESVSALNYVLHRAEEIPFFFETVCVTLGKLLLSAPSAEVNLEVFVFYWCRYIGAVEDQEEQERSIIGVCSHLVAKQCSPQYGKGVVEAVSHLRLFSKEAVNAVNSVDAQCR
ncbi:MAG: karyopherin beta 2 (transportin) [Amphiamblys sp. WSBS2006]|nr:MAG: karyopherin beta 2 (transportin) [Amphiamblys sp. WSBS2006]